MDDEQGCVDRQHDDAKRLRAHEFDEKTTGDSRDIRESDRAEEEQGDKERGKKVHPQEVYRRQDKQADDGGHGDGDTDGDALHQSGVVSRVMASSRDSPYSGRTVAD